ncbi:MAG TPA: NAD(P)H-binding protein [Burkholderiaceae bacterium]|nr:NAD(P)H-binding protein [Burkholderiaceae bacterium]
MRVAVAGGTGVLGRRAVARLRAAGHAVRTLVRAAPGGRDPDAVVGDLLDPSTLPSWLDGCDVALHLATALRPGPDGRIDWARNDALRTAGTAHLIDACRRAGVPRVLLQGVAFVRAPAADAWCDGDEPLAELPFLRSAREMERLAAEAALEATVLRGGLFYGPGTALDEQWAAAARARRWVVPANADDFVSLVHVDDMAAAVADAVGRRTGPGVVAVVDDAPVRWGELTTGLARLAGGHPVQPGPATSLPSFRVSNRCARERLRWRPAHPSWADGTIGARWLPRPSGTAGREA